MRKLFLIHALELGHRLFHSGLNVDIGKRRLGSGGVATYVHLADRIGGCAMRETLADPTEKAAAGTGMTGGSGRFDQREQRIGIAVET